MKHIIYKATNIENGKSYIGFTKKSLWERHENHLYEAFGRNSDYYFHRALRKYSIDVWEWNTLTECDTREDAGILEIKFIAEHKTFGVGGYNSTSGGESAFEMSEESKKKLSQSRKGIVFSDEHKENLSKALKGRTPWNKGKKISASHKENLSKALTGREPWNKDKPGCFSEETRQKMSETRTGRSTWNKDKKLSDEHKENLRKAMKGRPWSAARRAAHEVKKNAHINK